MTASVPPPHPPNKPRRHWLFKPGWVIGLAVFAIATTVIVTICLRAILR